MAGSPASGRPPASRTPSTTRRYSVASRSCSRVWPLTRWVTGSWTTRQSGTSPSGPTTRTVDALTLSSWTGPLNGRVTCGCTSKPSRVLTSWRSSQVVRFAAVQSGTGRARRRPVTCASSPTVKRSDGNSDVCGLAPERTVTEPGEPGSGSAPPAGEAAAAAVATRAAATSTSGARPARRPARPRPCRSRSLLTRPCRTVHPRRPATDAAGPTSVRRDTDGRVRRGGTVRGWPPVTSAGAAGRDAPARPAAGPRALPRAAGGAGPFRRRRDHRVRGRPGAVRDAAGGAGPRPVPLEAGQRHLRHLPGLRAEPSLVVLPPRADRRAPRGRAVRPGERGRLRHRAGLPLRQPHAARAHQPPGRHDQRQRRRPGARDDVPVPLLQAFRLGQPGASRAAPGAPGPAGAARGAGTGSEVSAATADGDPRHEERPAARAA